MTDVRGTYAFLVPTGDYYISVEAPGYRSYQSKLFTVSEGNEIHKNIELVSSYSSLFGADWKTVLLIVLSALLIYNFYRDRMRES